MLDTLTALVEAGAAATWVLPVVLLVAVFDALVPPVPSEGIVVALAAVAVAGDGGSVRDDCTASPGLPRGGPWGGPRTRSTGAVPSSSSRPATCRSAGSP